LRQLQPPRDPVRAQVVPSSADGLHCGRGPWRTRRGWTRRRPVLSGRAPLRRRSTRSSFCRRGMSSRPQRTGSIAADTRPSGRLPVVLGRPVLSGRAPLRHPGPARDRGPARPVVPSSADGLHCGLRPRGAHGRPGHRSSRPQRTGSIAA